MEDDEKQQLQQAWISSGEEDLAVASDLIRNKRYHYALYFCQLALEKVLKALYISRRETYPPITHDLILLVSKIDFPIDATAKEQLAEISTFNTEARYDIFKEKLYKKATKEFTELYLNTAKSLFQTFLSLI